MAGIYRSEGGRAALIGAIKRGDVDLAAARALGVFFAVMCPHCEYSMSFEKPTDIPKGNVPCRCPGDYLIRYQNQRVPESFTAAQVTKDILRVAGRSIRDDPPLSEAVMADLKSRYERAVEGSRGLGDAYQ